MVFVPDPFYAWRMKKVVVLLACLLRSLTATVAAAEDPVGDVYEEEGIEFQNFKPPPGSEWKEQDLVLPPYPSEDNLIRIDIERHDFPYKAFIDGASLSMAKDRVVRYTVVLRSKSGVDNVSYEGIRCPHRQYKRYAYGTHARFYRLPVNDWAFIHGNRQDLYRAVLAEDYFCPLPTGDVVAEIKAKLKGSGAGYIFPGDEE